MKRKPYRFHPAAMQLNALGVTGSTIASDVGLHPSAVSLQLAGRSPLRDDVRDAIIARVGSEAAAAVLATIPEQSEQAAASSTLKMSSMNNVTA